MLSSFAESFVSRLNTSQGGKLALTGRRTPEQSEIKRVGLAEDRR